MKKKLSEPALVSVKTRSQRKLKTKRDNNRLGEYKKIIKEKKNYAATALNVMVFVFPAGVASDGTFSWNAMSSASFALA
jgi:hypothetical protein